MGKFRSKLKRHTKGQRWQKGHSSTSNPVNMKHRSKARSRFFQPNLSLAPEQQPNEQQSANTLTMEAVLKHDARLQFQNGEKKDPTINDIATSMKSFNINGDDEMSESQLGGTTFKTFQTFASNYSSCSNMSFKKLLNNFRSTSDQHKEMLAILTALTEVIKERGGTESSTEYFILLMETIEASVGDVEIMACVSLLGMGIKSVPIPVLRKKFSETSKVLFDLLERYVNSDNQTVIKYIIGCLSVLLRAQDYSTWTYSSTMQNIDAILTFTINSKPKIRKAAQHAVVAIMHGSSFMIPSNIEEQNIDKNGTTNTADPNEKNTKKIYHPAGARVAKFCLNQFQPEILANSQTTILFTLTLLKDTISCLKTNDIRSICESLLSIMTVPNILIRTNCLQTLHSLFLSNTSNLTGILCGKIISAIYEYRPDKTDVRQTIAWLTVLKQGHIHLAHLDLKLCMNSLIRMTEICANDLWMSDRSEIVSSVSNTLKEILNDCVKLACSTQEQAAIYRNQISKIVCSMGKALLAPFGNVAKYVILTFSIVFEVIGEYFSDILQPHLSVLGSRYDPQSSLSVHIEHTIIAAIKSMGPENVLTTIPLTNHQNEILLERSWLLPLLRQGIDQATFKYFANYVLANALKCNEKWREYTASKEIASAHTYELLCCQLWGLFPGFCRNPKDPENFRLIAKTLGIAVVENTEFRAPIYDGLIEMITNSNQNVQNELAKYAKNFLPRLFNIYAMKPVGSYETDLRKKTLDVIKNFLTITPKEIQLELFRTANEQLKTVAPGTLESDAILDVTNSLLIYQNVESIKEFFESYIVPILKNEKCKFVSKDEQKLRKQQRKAYELLKDLLTVEINECKKFVKRNTNNIQKLLCDTLTTSCLVCQASRLKCLKILIENRKNITIADKLIEKTIPEAVVSFREFSNKKEAISQELITLIADLYQKEDALNQFLDIIMAGFGGDQILITNTILTLRSIVQNLTGNLTVNTLEFILTQVLVYLVQKSRSECEAGIAFLITFVKVLPVPLVANHLETIMKALAKMVPDTKRYCRIQIGYLLKKLCKRFTAEELTKLVPGNDEVTHRRLKKIRKQLRRDNRKRINDEHQQDNQDENSEDDFIDGLEKKSATIDDILADSETDLSDLDESDHKNDKNSKKSKKLNKKKEMFIHEEPGEIVDLADIKSIGNVLTNRPKSNLIGNKTKKPLSNRGFRTADDGRLIISDKYMNDDSNSSDNDADDMDIDDNKVKKVKRGLEDDSSDEEETKTSKRKRKVTDTSSHVSGKSGASRYTAGGKGIHRPNAGSMKSGYSGVTKVSAATTKSMGNTYAMKKAKGDMKKSGQLDPYAYIPLTRNILNKRKRAKNAGQFKSIVQGARKGALKGTKSRTKIQKRK